MFNYKEGQAAEFGDIVSYGLKTQRTKELYELGDGRTHCFSSKIPVSLVFSRCQLITSRMTTRSYRMLLHLAFTVACRLSVSWLEERRSCL